MPQENTAKVKRSWPKLYAGMAVAVMAVTGTLIVVLLKSPVRRTSNIVREQATSPLVPIPARSRYLNTSASVAYVGSHECKRCHEEHYATYSLTTHSRSMLPVHVNSQPPDGEFVHGATGLIYTSYRKNGQLRHKEEAVANGKPYLVADFPLKYLVGSGRFARTYLIERDGLLVESPLTWYASAEQWSLSPGFEDDRHPTFWRAIPAGCLQCHCGDVRPASDKVGHISVKEAAIGCERCHGPGELHVSKREQDGLNTINHEDLTIVNPGELSRELADDVCAQCHLQSAARIRVRGRPDGTFRPGRRLRDFYVDYRLDPPESRMEVVGHVEQMKMSRCYQRSSTLTCITCHNPHSESAAPNWEYFRRMCLTCHQESQCKANERHREITCRDDCVQCHMPQAPTEVPHVVFTHHRIGIHPQVSKANQQQFRQLVAVTSISDHPVLDQKRALGLASARVFLDHATDPTFQPIGEQASQLLLEVSEQELLDEEVALALGSFAILNGDPQAALQMADRGLQQPAPLVTRIRLLRLALDALLNQGQYEAATDVLSRLVQFQEDVEYWFMLGLCESKLGNRNEAIDAFERAVELDPLHAASYEALAKLYEEQGNTEVAARTRNRLSTIPETLRSDTGNIRLNGNSREN